MGGRGQSSMGGRGRGGNGLDAIRNARSFKEVAEKAASYGIDVNYKAFENYGKFDLDTVKNSVVGIALVRQEFSQLDAIIGKSLREQFSSVWVSTGKTVKRGGKTFEVLSNKMTGQTTEVELRID